VVEVELVEVVVVMGVDVDVDMVMLKILMRGFVNNLLHLTPHFFSNLKSPPANI